MSYKTIWGASEEDCYQWFVRLRFHETGGQPVCPVCKRPDYVRAYQSRRIFKCCRQTCDRQFSATTGTVLHHRKMEYQKMMGAIFEFLLAPRGRAALQIGNGCDLNYSSSYPLIQKAREAMAHEQFGKKLTGHVEVDGKLMPQHRRPPNDETGWTKGRNTVKQVVITMRERKGRTLTFVVKRESEAVPLLFQHIDPSATVHLDLGPHWNDDAIRAFFHKVDYVNHSANKVTIIDEKTGWVNHGSHTNNAESYNDRLERAQWVYSRISGVYLDLYAAEMAWRRDHRQESNGVQFEKLMQLIIDLPTSSFSKYRYLMKAPVAPPYTPRRARAY